MFCKKCGKQLKDEAQFCQYCGEQVTPSDAEIKLSAITDSRQTAPGPAGRTGISRNLVLAAAAVMAVALAGYFIWPGSQARPGGGKKGGETRVAAENKQEHTEQMPAKETQGPPEDPVPSAEMMEQPEEVREPEETVHVQQETETSLSVETTEESIQEWANSQEETIAADNSQYILPTSDSEYLTRADLQGLSREECRLARNELYARHGRMFDAADLQAYFNSCEWYEGRIAPADFNEAMLNGYEVANRDLIIGYEKAMGYQ